MARGWGITVVFVLAVAAIATTGLFGLSLVRHALMCETTVVRTGETLSGMHWMIEVWGCGEKSRHVWSVRAGPADQRMRLFLESTGHPEPLAVAQAGNTLTITVRRRNDGLLQAVPVVMTQSGEPVQVVRFVDGLPR